MWDSICRICSSPAEYEVFAKIPTYLHANTNDFQNWQKPINVLMEETTGLKVSSDDGLPRSICALCISYLKHAVTFREQCIKNALSLKAVETLKQRNVKNTSINDKEQSLLISAHDLNYSEERQADTNLLMNNAQQDHDKVRKKLLNNSLQTRTTPSQQNVEQQLRYLNLLFDKGVNSGLRSKYRNPITTASGFDKIVANDDDPYADEEFQTATSSDENTGDAVNQNKHNIFTYKEKNFEEDDIMDMDELRDAITINIPESCKERKCRACFRRFMFEESYKEHIHSCIEYKFLTYIEEINRLLDIRRNKAISPHEFIRRMIFSLRKTCDWLKVNCGDMLLPDLLQSSENANKKRADSEGNKSSATSSGEQKQQAFIIDKMPLLFDTTNKMTDFNLDTENDDLSGPFKKPKSVKSRISTPINISNNILYEIERSQSRNSNMLNQSYLDLSSSTEIMRPIALLSSSQTTSSTTTTKITCTSINQNNGSNTTNVPNDQNDVDRKTFLQKLQKAACQTPPITALHQQSLSTTASLNLTTTLQTDELCERTPVKEMKTNMPFIARCNPCNIVFGELASLELHNAMHHNDAVTAAKAFQQQAESTPTPNLDAELERKKIIALFEDDDSIDE